MQKWYNALKTFCRRRSFFDASTHLPRTKLCKIWYQTATTFMQLSADYRQILLGIWTARLAFLSGLTKFIVDNSLLLSLCTAEWAYFSLFSLQYRSSNVLSYKLHWRHHIKIIFERILCSADFKCSTGDLRLKKMPSRWSGNDWYDVGRRSWRPILAVINDWILPKKCYNYLYLYWFYKFCGIISFPWSQKDYFG